MKYYEYLISWIIEQVSKAKKKGVIVGISGGVDSALVAFLAKKAFPNNSLGLLMPIFDLEEDLNDARDVVNDSKIQALELDLSSNFNDLKKKMSLSDKLAIANLKPRLRMTALYAAAQQRDYLVLGTDNLSEWNLGYFTKYGDGAADLQPIIHLTKDEVFEMAKSLKISKKILHKKPSAGLWEGQSDEQELGFTYRQYDQYQSGALKDSKITHKIRNQIASTNHKRTFPSRPLQKSQVDLA